MLMGSSDFRFWVLTVKVTELLVPLIVNVETEVVATVFVTERKATLLRMVFPFGREMQIPGPEVSNPVDPGEDSEP